MGLVLTEPALVTPPAAEVRAYASVAAYRACHFDALCVGEATIALGKNGRLRPSGGALSSALALARAGMRAGLCAAMADEPAVREMAIGLRERGVDASGITLVKRALALTPRIEDEAAIEIPSGWTANLLLISGLSPALEPAAALCRAARAFRKTGHPVVVDVNARARLWRGHDPRTLQGILREADLVRCTADDLFALWTDAASIRAAMRPHARLMLGELATGEDRGDEITAAICAELLRVGDPHAIDEERVIRTLALGA